MFHGLCLVAQSCPTLCNSMDCSPPGSSIHGDSSGKNTGVGCHALLQGIFPTQGSNTGLPHCRQILLPSEPPGSIIFHGSISYTRTKIKFWYNVTISLKCQYFFETVWNKVIQNVARVTNVKFKFILQSGLSWWRSRMISARPLRKTCHTSFFNLFLTGGYWPYNVALVSAIQQCESAIIVLIDSPSWTSLPPPPHPTLLGCLRALGWVPSVILQLNTSYIF